MAHGAVNIELALRLRGQPRAGRRAAAERWISELGLAGFGDYLPKSLSGECASASSSPAAWPGRRAR